MLARVRFSPIAGGCIDLESLKCAVRNNFAVLSFCLCACFFFKCILAYVWITITVFVLVAWKNHIV